MLKSESAWVKLINFIKLKYIIKQIFKLLFNPRVFHAETIERRRFHVVYTSFQHKIHTVYFHGEDIIQRHYSRESHSEGLLKTLVTKKTWYKVQTSNQAHKTIWYNKILKCYSIYEGTPFPSNDLYSHSYSNISIRQDLPHPDSRTGALDVPLYITFIHRMSLY